MSRAGLSVIALGALCLVATSRAAADPPAATTAEPSAGVRRGTTEESEERLYGLTIEHVTLTAAPSEDTQQLRTLSGLVEGQAYVASEVRRAVKVLYQLGRFENVYVSAARVGNGVSLELVLPARPTVRQVEIVGNVSLGRAEVEAALGLTAGSELDVRTFAQRRARLEALYREIGHRSPAIGLAETAVDLEGHHDVTVRIDEGPRTRLRAVVIEGDPRLPLPLLRRSAGLDPGDMLDLDVVRRALVELAAEYRRRGYLEVKIDEPEVSELGELGGQPAADLVVHIEAGPRVLVRFAGQHAVSRRELDEAAEVMKTGGLGAGAAALAEVRERILARYERRGYWEAEVKPLVRLSTNGKKKYVLFSIHEGRASWIASLSFTRTSTRAQATSPLLADDALRERVFEVVADTLSEEIGAPGVDPTTTEDLVGDRSIGQRKVKQPDTTSPDPRRIFVVRAYRAARDAIADLYRAEGYTTVSVSEPKVSVRGRGPLVDVTFEIDPGLRWHLGALSFAGNESIGSSTLLEVGKLDPQRVGGEPFSFYNIDEARHAMLEHYRNEGYLYARVQEAYREVPERGSLSASEFVKTSTSAPLLRLRKICKDAELAGKPSCGVELVFEIAEGPLVHTRNLVVRGIGTTRESLVRSQIAVTEGQVLRDSDMLATRLNLLRIGVFERVSVRPLDEKNEAAEKDVVVELRERKHSAFEVGAGASTAEGVRVFGGYSHDNLFGTALRLQVNGKLNVQPFLLLYDEAYRSKIESFYDRYSGFARVERELAVGVSAPRIFGLPPGFGAGLDLSVVRDLSPAYLQDAFAATLRFDYKGLRPVLNEKQRPITLQLKAGFDYSVLECNDAGLVTTSSTTDPSQPCIGSRGTQRGTSTYATIGPRVAFDLRDDPLNPAAGAYLELEGSFAKALDPGATDYFRAEGTFNLYLPLASGVGLAFSLFAGELFPLDDTSIPVNRRYFAGGNKTIRGYAEQSLFPQDAPPVASETISRGGLLVFALKNELRFPMLGALSGAFFLDVGDLFEDPKNFRIDSHTRQAVGMGIRYATPVGPLSLDIGFPVVRRDPGEVGPVVHFSVRSF